jgi:hypothetical protein
MIFSKNHILALFSTCEASFYMFEHTFLKKRLNRRLGAENFEPRWKHKRKKELVYPFPAYFLTLRMSGKLRQKGRPLRTHTTRVPNANAIKSNSNNACVIYAAQRTDISK